MFQSNNVSQVEKVTITKKWLGRQGLQSLEALNQEDHEACNTEEGVFETLINKFRPQHMETIKSLQY